MCAWGNSAGEQGEHNGYAGRVQEEPVAMIKTEAGRWKKGMEGRVPLCGYGTVEVGRVFGEVV